MNNLEYRPELEYDIWQPGDLNKLFRKLTNEPYLTKYSVVTLSSPETGGPWVVQLDNVMTEEEADVFIELGGRLLMTVYCCGYFTKHYLFLSNGRHIC